MKLLLENWRKFLNEKKWEDYEVPKDEWFDIPLEDIKQGAIERGGEINIADELYSLIDTAYSKIGGHLKLPNVETLPGKYTDWIAVDLDDDPEPDATRFSKGPKMSGSGHDGTRKGIDAYLAKTAQLLKTQGCYGEMSKGIAHIRIKYHNVPFVPSQEDVEKVKIYPNPFKDVLLLNSKQQVEVLDILGQLIFSAESTNRISTSTWGSGIYFIHLPDKKQALKVIKIQ